MLLAKSVLTYAHRQTHALLKAVIYKNYSLSSIDSKGLVFKVIPSWGGRQTGMRVGRERERERGRERSLHSAVVILN